MNEKKIIKHLMMQILEKTSKGIWLIDGPETFDIIDLKVCFKDIEHLARMIIED